MTEVTDREWRPMAQALADEIGADEDWKEPFVSTPRHVFVPSYWPGGSESVEITVDDSRWLSGVYSDEPLTVQRRAHPDHPGTLWPTSSSSRPSLMLSMLQALEIRDGDRVLEVGPARDTTPRCSRRAWARTMSSRSTSTLDLSLSPPGGSTGSPCAP